MANYYMNEAALDLPSAAFVDATIHALEAKLPSGETLAVFVHRSPIEGGKSLRALVDEHIAMNTTRLAGFAVLEDAPRAVGGMPGLHLRTRFRMDGATLCQLQAHVVVSGAWMVFAVSAPERESAACEEAFDRLLRSLAWREGLHRR